MNRNRVINIIDYYYNKLYRLQEGLYLVEDKKKMCEWFRPQKIIRNYTKL